MQKICMTEDVPEREARGFESAAGMNFFVTQRDGRYFAYRNLCPHLQVELEYLEHQFLDADAEFIQCSTHGALFDIESGRCISGPCLGEALQKLNIEVHSDGGIYLNDNEAN